MATRSKVLLGMCAVFLGLGILVVTGVIPIGSLASAYVLLPLGAIFFGLFLISLILEKESAAYIQDEKTQIHHIEEIGAISPESSVSE